VSQSFIQTGRPSDSGHSGTPEDGKHDIAMDSMTLSLHFRNIAPPDVCTTNSGASLMTTNSGASPTQGIWKIISLYCVSGYVPARLDY
jgi:hypothetical protein